MKCTLRNLMLFINNDGSTSASIDGVIDVTPAGASAPVPVGVRVRVGMPQGKLPKALLDQTCILGTEGVDAGKVLLTEVTTERDEGYRRAFVKIHNGHVFDITAKAPMRLSQKPLAKKDGTPLTLQAGAKGDIPLFGVDVQGEVELRFLEALPAATAGGELADVQFSFQKPRAKAPAAAPQEQAAPAMGG